MYKGKQTRYALAGAVLSLLLLMTSMALAEPPGAKQVGAFRSKKNADALMQKVRKSGNDAMVEEKLMNGENYFVVYKLPYTPKPAQELVKQQGSFSDKKNALLLLNQLREAGASAFICVKDISGRDFYRVYEKPADMPEDPCQALNSRAFDEATGEAVAGSAPQGQDKPAAPPVSPVEPQQGIATASATLESSRPPAPAPSAPAVVQDMPKYEPLDSAARLYVTDQAVVFKSMEETSEVLGTWRDFGGGRILGQSGNWYVVRFNDSQKTTAYILKSHTVTY